MGRQPSRMCLRSGLRGISVSRSTERSEGRGIPLPDDPSHAAENPYAMR